MLINPGDTIYANQYHITMLVAFDRQNKYKIYLRVDLYSNKFQVSLVTAHA